MATHMRRSIFVLLVLLVFCLSGCPPSTTYTLTTSVQGDGSVVLEPLGGAYPAGTTVTLTPVAPEGSRFDHWEGALSGNSTPVVLLVSQNTSVVAVFIAPIFPDLGLESIIRVAIGKPDGEILMSDLLSVTSLNLSGLAISSLEGLQYCENLTELILTYNALSDVTVLGTLTNLRELDLSNNNIVSIAPLASLTNLERVYLADNQITDVSPLSGLVNLEILSLANNPISEMGSLATNPGIGGDDVVDLRGTYITMDACADIFALLDRDAVDVINDLTCEGEPVCPVESDVDEEGDTIYAYISTAALDFYWLESDLDANGILDHWEAAVVSEVLCDRNGALQYYEPLRIAYQDTLAIVATEDSYIDVIREFEHAIIVVSLVSRGLFQAVVIQAQVDAEDVLALDYISFMVGDSEVFSATGDPDDDGLTNLEEYDRVIAAGGTRSDYVTAVLTYDPA